MVRSAGWSATASTGRRVTQFRVSASAKPATLEKDASKVSQLSDWNLGNKFAAFPEAQPAGGMDGVVNFFLLGYNKFITYVYKRGNTTKKTNAVFPQCRLHLVRYWVPTPFPHVNSLKASQLALLSSFSVCRWRHETNRDTLFNFEKLPQFLVKFSFQLGCLVEPF